MSATNKTVTERQNALFKCLGTDNSWLSLLMNKSLPLRTLGLPKSNNNEENIKLTTKLLQLRTISITAAYNKKTASE